MLDELDDSVLTRGTHAHLGVMWADLGEYDRCLAAFRAVGMPEFPSIEPGRRGWIYAALARTDLARGDREAAQAWADRSERVLEGLGLPFADAWLLHARAAIALDAGDAEVAVRLAFEAIERGEAVEAPLTAARCRTLAGVALAAAGRREEGVRELTRAEAELSALGAARHRDEAAREPPARRARHRPPAPARRPGARRAVGPRARDRRAGRRGAHQPRDRRRAVPVREDRRGPPHPHLRQARRGLRVEVAEVVGRTRAAL